jgi:2-polyprenyl-3-methyl-5-hydroxy-6-metoxy-1,4-benzoquinol methylase
MSDYYTRKTCELCRFDQFEPFKDIHRLNRRIVKCRKCGLIFVNPMETSFLTLDFEESEDRELKYRRMKCTAEQHGKHDEDVINQEEAIRTLHFRSRKHIIEGYLNGGNLLDVGCGRGFFLANFVGSNVDYVGVEPRRRISEEARKRVGAKNIFCGTLKEAEFPSAYFDAVTMINLIEHLPSPANTLKEANRIMKDSAVLLIETPNVDSFIPVILGSRWHAFLESEHHCFFSSQTLTRMLNNTGFRVLSVTRGDKLFSVPYLLYRLGWYSTSLPIYLEKVLGSLNLMKRTVKIPQFDELIVVAMKTTDIGRADKEEATA